MIARILWGLAGAVLGALAVVGALAWAAAQKIRHKGWME